MNKAKAFLLMTMCFISSCAKDTVTVPETQPEPIKPPKVEFIFVNRLGFRNDSTRHGINDTILQGVCLDLKYYDKKANYSYLDGICYNRNFPANNHPLSDSVLFNVLPGREYEASPGCKFQFQIDLIWKRPIAPTTTKVLKYTSLRFPESDTIKFARDTVIKFIWPDDTSSGRFKKGTPI